MHQSTPCISYNLKLPEALIIPPLKRRVVNLEQIGIANDTLDELISLKLIPYPVATKASKHISITEHIWIMIVQELMECNYSYANLWSHMVILFADIVTDFDSSSDFEEDSAGNIINISYDITSTPTLLDSLIKAVLVEKQDIQLQFSRDGNLGFVTGLTCLESYPLSKPGTVSFSIYKLLESIVGKNNLPEINSSNLLVSPVEAKVVRSMREKEWSKVHIDRAAKDQKHNWLVTYQATRTVTKHDFNSLINSLPQYHKVSNVESQYSNIRFDYIKRERL